MRAESTRRKDGLGGQKMKQNTYRIAENRALTESVWEMTLKGDTSACERPGQFVNIKLESFFLRRPISVCDYDENTIKIIYKTVGAGTKEMSQMRQGQTLDVLTGLGNGYDIAKAGNMPLLIGGGAGIPPLYGLLRHLKKENPECEAKVILGFNTKEEIFYKEEFEALGAEVFLYFDIDEVNCTARVNPRTTARPGDEVTFALDVEKIHVFDKETQVTITN